MSSQFGQIPFEFGFPRLYQGYMYLGPVQIPPKPQQIVLTDRQDGTLWLVEHNTTDPTSPIDGFGRIGITTVIPQRTLDRTGTQGPAPDIIVYPAFSEPYLAPGVQLIVRNGHLGMDVHPDAPIVKGNSIPGDTTTDNNQAPLYIRSPINSGPGFTQTIAFIHLPPNFNINGGLGADTPSFTVIAVP